MDASAITEILNNNAATYLGNRIRDTHVPTVALPDGYRVLSLDQYEQLKSRFTGRLSTTSMESFVDYHREHGGIAPTFIDADTMMARTIFDLGSTEAPQHCEHSAELRLKKTSPYSSFVTLASGVKYSQRELAEWIEDWRDFIQSFDADGVSIPTKTLIATVRKITIESVRKADSTEASFSSQKSAMEQIEARSDAGSMPAMLIFKCCPFADLPEQEFRFRISIRTGGDAIGFGVHRIQAEKDEEIYAANFVNQLSERLEKDTPIYIGSFNTK